MPNFKEFIKGFEEKPEAEKPKTPEVKAEQPKQQPKPAEQPQQGRMVYRQGKQMPFEEAKAQAKESYSTPKGRKLSEEEEKYLDKAAELEVEEDDNYARWYYETDPNKKAELSKNGDALGKKIKSFMDELDKEPIDQPKTSNYRQWRSNPENAKREKEADAKYKPLYEELDKKDDELYKAYYYEQDPEKKAELKSQLDENDKKFDALFEEWGEATGYPETPEEKRAWLALRNMSQPKEGSFEKAFGENEAEEYNAEDYQNAAPNREAAQKLGNAKPTDFSPYVFDTDQGRFSIVNDEQARKDGAEMIKAYFQDEQGFDTFPAEIAQDLKAKFGDPSQDEDLEINYQTVADYFIDKYGYSRMLTPHTGKVIDLGNGYKAYQITEKQGD